MRVELLWLALIQAVLAVPCSVYLAWQQEGKSLALMVAFIAVHWLGVNAGLSASRSTVKDGG